MYPERKSQKEAAIEGVRKVGLRQIKAVDEMLFESAPEWKKMFFKRLNILKQYDTGAVSYTHLCEVVVISLDMSSYGEIFLRGNTEDERPAMSLFR